MKLIPSCLVVALLAFPAVRCLAAEQKPQPEKSSPEKPDQAELEKQFTEKMSGVALVGSFTVDGRNDGKLPREERYEITKVSKLRDDYWVFNARIKYGKINLIVPVTVKVLWAGDTPMISLTDLTIPGLGSAFTSRIIFYGDRYAGTWQHGKVGGHMFGTIEKLKPPEKDNTKKEN